MVKLLIKVTAIIALLITQAGLASEKPNILLIVLDDWGWRDAGFMENNYIETPTLDKLANEGLIFQNAYSNSPNCASSRAAIMSGQYAPRTEVYTMMTGDMGDARLRRVQTPPNKMYLEPKVITLAETLKAAGYRTAHIGKWNLGSGDVRGPTGQGFDLNIAGDRNGTARNGHFAPYDLPGLEQAPAGEYLTDRLSAEAIGFIEQSSDKPFFIHLSHFAPHFPYQAPEALVQKYQAKSSSMDALTEPLYAAMVERIDTGIGKIITALRAQNLLENTLIIVTSDNGGYEDISYMRPLRGQKSLLYEGGIRVPLLFSWPGHIRPGATETPVMGIDFFPTLMQVAGVSSVNQTLDGKDISPLFNNSDADLQRDALYWYFPGYVAGNYDKAADTLFQQRPVAVIRQGDWKLILSLENDSRELYDLSKDPGEQHNLSVEQKLVAEGMAIKLHQWLKEMDAPLPLLPNPAYDKKYEKHYANSWWRKMRHKLSQTRYGAFLREKDL
jgi:arylsulfatase A-like enzyme